MDLWDVTKLMWRRWYVTAPLLLVTVAAAGWVFASVGPQYQATGHVAVVPPEVHRLGEAGQASRVNPWDEEALAHSARIRLEAKRLEDEMKAAGFEGEWGVDVTGRVPVITMEVVAPTADQAVALMHELQQVVEQEVRIRQADYNLPAEEQVTTVRLDDGESIETTSSRLLRVLVAVVGALLVLTVAVVLVFDAIARWRSGRAAAAVRGGDPTRAAAASTEQSGEPRARYTYASTGPTSGVPAGPGATNGQDRHLTTNGRSGAHPSAPVDEITDRHDEPPTEPVSPGPSEMQPVPDDSTVILPLSGSPWAGSSQRTWPPEPAGSDWDEPRAGRH